MSRSKQPQCSGGRGCYVCGDAGEVRRERDDEAGRIDLEQGLAAIDLREYDCQHPCSDRCDDCGDPDVLIVVPPAPPLSVHLAEALARSR